MKIQSIIRQKRLELGLTQKALGIEIGYPERYAQSKIAQIETFTMKVPRDRIIKMAEILKIPASLLID
jgi:transcriptional regulator with XRE-family HTH domain